MSHEEAILLDESLLFSTGEVIDMVTYSDLILIGQLIVAVLNLFFHIYNNKKK